MTNVFTDEDQNLDVDFFEAAVARDDEAAAREERYVISGADFFDADASEEVLIAVKDVDTGALLLVSNTCEESIP